LLGDTWVWDGSGWSERIPSNSPSARFGAAMAWDAAHQRVVLFGGRDAQNILHDDTWEWDGTTWSQRFPQTPPGPGYGDAAMTYDAARQQVVFIRNGVLWRYLP
jgi:hypothetical protein